MRYIVFIIGFLMLGQTANAQLFSKERIANIENFDEKFLTWGYFLGFNSYDFKIDYKEQINDELTDIMVERNAGFNVGLIGDMRLTPYLNLRLEPGLYFTQRNLRFANFAEENNALREVKSTYIHVPLLMKFSTKRLNNIRPFIVGGISQSINLSSNENNPEDNNEGQFRMTKGTSYFELGFGVDFYLYFFKFTPSIRGVFAINDELVPDDDPISPWTSNIEKLSTRGIFINFTFQ